MDEQSAQKGHQPADNQPAREESQLLAPEVEEAELKNKTEGNSEPDEDAKKKRKHGIWAKWKLTSLPNKLNIVLTAIIVGLTLVNVVSDWKQSTEQEKQADRLIDALERTLQQNKEALGATLKQNREALDSTLAQNKASLSATLDQTDRTLQANAEALRLDQRPWITVPAFHIQAEPEGEKEIRGSGLMVNSGKSPAIKIVPQTFMVISSRPQPPAFKFPVAIVPQSSSTLAPGSVPLTFTSAAHKFTEEAVALYSQRKARLYFLSLIRYRDTFDVPHWVIVCAYRVHGSPLDQVNFCPEGNDMDHNQKKEDPEMPPA